MKKLFGAVLAVLSINASFSQIDEHISNGGFESGPLPTPPGLINQATGWSIGCVHWTNAWGEPVYGSPDIVDINGPTAAPGLNRAPMDGKINPRATGNTRFAGILNYDSPSIGGESIISPVFSYALSTSYVYTVSFWLAAWNTPSGTDPVFKMEVLLRKNNDCSTSKLVYTSVNVTVLNKPSSGATSNWTQYTGTFVPDAADVIAGYNQIEIRINGNSAGRRIGIDDVSLKRKLLPSAAYSFTMAAQTQTTTPSKYGPIPVTESCKTPVTIDGSASTNEAGYYISVTKFDASTWLDIDPPMFAQWICGPASNCQVPASINLSALSGVSFVAGQLYRIRLSVGPEWNTAEHYFRPTVCPSQAAFVFTDSRQTVANVPSHYGPVQVTSICKPDVIIDGSASTSETEYQLTITKFDLDNWVPLGSQIFNQTYFNTTVPASINLENLSGVNFTPSNTDVYEVSIITKPVWNIATRYMKVIDCGTLRMLEATDLQPDNAAFQVFPNPATDQLNIIVNGDEALQSADIYDLKGILVQSVAFSGTSSRETLDISMLNKGLYLVKSVATNGNVHQTRIIKE
jgi:hypothetical protein